MSRSSAPVPGDSDTGAGYAVAHLRNVQMGADIVRYLHGIDATLEPYRGRFLVHAGGVQVLEGPWSGTLIVIEFPDRATAEAWYTSEAYQAILPLRLRHAEGWAVLVDGVPDGHRATDVLDPVTGRPGAATPARPRR